MDDLLRRGLSEEELILEEKRLCCSYSVVIFKWRNKDRIMVGISFNSIKVGVGVEVRIIIEMI